jgi:hypothetical protein
VDQNKPYDELATGIVLGAMRSRPDQPYEEYVREMAGYFRTGDTADFGARETMPWFWARQNVAKAEDKALAFAHTFLGVRIECAQCHKHPFDQWTKQDFAQFQAFFTTIGFRQGEGKKGVGTPVKTFLVGSCVGVGVGLCVADIDINVINIMVKISITFIFFNTILNQYKPDDNNIAKDMKKKLLSTKS